MAKFSERVGLETMGKSTMSGEGRSIAAQD